MNHVIISQTTTGFLHTTCWYVKIQLTQHMFSAQSLLTQRLLLRSTFNHSMLTNSMFTKNPSNKDTHLNIVLFNLVNHSQGWWIGGLINNSESALKVKTRNHVSAYFWTPLNHLEILNKNMKLLNTIKSSCCINFKKQ